MTLFDIQQAALYFLSAANALLKETYTSDILRQMNSRGVNREILEKLITEKTNAADMAESSSQSALQDWKYFEDLLDLNSSDDISHIKVKTRVEKSHNKCLFLANTLRSAKEVVACLNTIISAFLISASLILWLILTGLANTSALVLIASPLLAATFIFGDTCKSFFQGIIFIYVVHPFDVGDLCVIDGKMMEVKAIGVWKTTFSNIDRVCTPEEVIYPNSDLALKMFINHKTEFDWKDYVEVNVEHLDEQQIKELKRQIQDLLDAERDESMPSSYSVTVISAGKDIKVAVHFRHKKPDADMTYCECLKEKDNLRSAFILDIQRLVSKEIDDKFSSIHS